LRSSSSFNVSMMGSVAYPPALGHRSAHLRAAIPPRRGLGGNRARGSLTGAGCHVTCFWSQSGNTLWRPSCCSSISWIIAASYPGSLPSSSSCSAHDDHNSCSSCITDPFAHSPRLACKAETHHQTCSVACSSRPGPGSRTCDQET
jgi:hypothetical protein